MKIFIPAGAALCLALSACTTVPDAPDLAALAQEVTQVEMDFARTMADRDLAAFQSYLADDAVFVSGPSTLRGKAEITAAWAGFYAAETAPFSWAPEKVEVLAAGDLALSTGPVRDPAGATVAIFTSVWRRESPGTWRIIFDRGTQACISGK